VYATGYYNGTVDFDPGAGIANMTATGNPDVFVLKLNSSGALLWAKSLGGSNAAYGRSIDVDSSGNVYTTGNFDGTADFDPGSGTENLSSAGGSGDNDVFVSKLNSSGEFVWAKSFVGTNAGCDPMDMMCSNNYEVGYSIAIDGSSNVYAAGYFIKTVDFDPGSGTEYLTSAGNGDAFIVKMNSAGSTSATTTTTPAASGPRVPGQVPPWPEAIPNVDGTVTVSWAEPFQDGAGPITGYRAVARPQTTGVAQASDTPMSMASGGSCSTTGFVCVIAGLEENVDYLFEVFASNSEGESAGRMTQQAIRIVPQTPATTIAPTTTTIAPTTTAIAPTTTTIAPTTTTTPPASGGGSAAAAAPVVVAPSAGVKVPLTPSSARFAPEIFAGERSAAQALVGGKPVDVTSSVEGSQKATFEVGSVTLGLGVAADEGAIGSNLGAPTPDVKRGGSVALDMTGLRPETSLRVFFPFGNGSFAELPSFSVGEDGSVSGDLSLDTPGSQRPLPIGAFSLQFVGQDEDDNEIVVDVPIEVRQPDPAPEVNRFSGDRPALSVNELVAFNGGAPENVVSEASADGVSITGADWQMAVGDGDPGTEGLNFTPGEANTVAGEGFMPGTRVDIWLLSTPTLAGSLEVNDEGEFSSEFVVDVATGNHTLQIQGVGADGFIRAANLGVTVVEPTTEAMDGAEQTTSSGMTWLWWVIGLLLVTGAGAGALLWLSRRTQGR
jgi:hypothetical protein